MAPTANGPRQKRGDDLDQRDAPAEPLPALYTVAEVARHVRADQMTILAAIHAGELKAGKVGRRYLILPSAVAEWCSRVNP